MVKPGIIKKTGVALALAVVVVSGIIAWRLFFRDSDKAAIRKHLHRICELASKYPNEGNARGLLKSEALQSMFHEPCYLDIRAHLFVGQYTRREIAANSMRYRSFFNHVYITLHDLEIELLSPTEARAEFTGACDGILKNGERVNQYRELVCELIKIDNNWLVARVVIRPILQR